MANSRVSCQERNSRTVCSAVQGPPDSALKHFNDAAQVDILIVNCSLFNPTPSLSAMIVNYFKFKSNVVTYNLSGMGCSAGVIAISLARELLQVRTRHSIEDLPLVPFVGSI